MYTVSIEPQDSEDPRTCRHDVQEYTAHVVAVSFMRMIMYMAMVVEVWRMSR